MNCYLCAGNSIHFRHTHNCSWESVEPSTFRLMLNALTYWAIRARHLLSHVFEYWLWWCRYFWSKVNIWNVDRARATTFIFNTQTLIWNLRVKFMSVVIGQGITVSPVPNWFTSFFACINLTNNSWCTIIWNLTLKNSMSYYCYCCCYCPCYILLLSSSLSHYYHYYCYCCCYYYYYCYIIIIIIIIFFWGGGGGGGGGWRLYLMADCIYRKISDELKWNW